jgi:hypothetical protein
MVNVLCLRLDDFQVLLALVVTNGVTPVAEI